MKYSARLLTLALTVGAAPAYAAAAPAPVTVTRYTFDAGAPAGRIADTSGRGGTLVTRVADRGVIRLIGTAKGGYAAFPAPCATGAKTCPRALLEAPDDADLDPGTRRFRWSATIRVGATQVAGSANVMQKGVSSTDSQWKLQLGARHGRAQCVVVGRGTTTPYLVRSAVTVADGAWHTVGCERSGGGLTVSVDGRISGRLAIPATLSIGNSLPLRVGGPNFNTDSDMYHGRLDNVTAVLG